MSLSIECYYQNLENISGIHLNVINPNIAYNYSYFPILIEKEKVGFDRNHLVTILNKCNIFPRKYFWPLTSEAKCYKNKYNIDRTPYAKFASENILCLPVYVNLEIRDVVSICEKIRACTT